MKNKLGRGTGLGVALIAVGVLAFGGQALAYDSPGNGSDLGDAPSLPVDPPSEIEIAAIPNEEFSSAVVPVLESFPNDYAFFYFDSEHKPVIGFTNEVVPAVMDAVTATGQKAQIIEDTGFTQAEYRATAEKVIVDLQATWPQDVLFPMIDVRPDLGVGAIGAILITPEDSSDSARSIQESTRLIEEADTESPFSIQIDEKQVFGEGELAGYGRQAGEWLVEPAGAPYYGHGYCTAGFVAKSTSSADLGVLTAGHCPVFSPTRYYNDRTGEVVTLTSSGGAAFGSAGDARFLRSPVMFDAWFMTTPTTGRNVQAKNDPTQGAAICFFGKTSNIAKCGVVASVSTTTQLDGTWVSQQTVLNTVPNQTAEHGDSGGPAYINNVAKGLISGIGNGWTSITRTSVAQNITGTQICIDPVCS